MTYLNRRWGEITGQDPREGVRVGADAYVHPDDLPVVAAAWRRRLPGGAEEGRDFTFEYRLRRPAGGYCWYLGRVVAERDADGRVVRWVGTGTDIDDQKRVEQALADANAQLQEAGLEVELSNQQLQDQAAELEAAGEELQATAVRLEEEVATAERARSALAESEARFRQLAETVDVVFWLAEPNYGRLLYVNPAFERVYGRSLAAFTADPTRVFIESVHPEDRERVAAAAATQASGLYDVEYRVVHPDGTVRWVHDRAFPVRDATGRVVRIAGVAEDVTEARRREDAERMLAAASAALAAVQDADVTLGALTRLAVPALADWCAVDVLDGSAESPVIRRVAVAHGDPAKLQLAFELHARYGPSLEDVGGIGAVMRTGQSEMIPEITTEMLDAAGHDADRRGLLDALGLRSYVAVPIAVRGRRYGTLTLVQAESGRRFDARDLALAEDLARRVGVAIENAELVAAERRARAEAEAARLDAEAANQTKAQFLANMSHELRTPLNAIGGYVQLLEMGLHGPVTDEQRGALGRVQAAQTRLLALINDILNYAKLESGRVEYDVRAVDVADVVRDVAPLVAPQLRAKGLAFELALPESPCVVWADREKLGQVLVNLLSNAIKFTPSADPRTGAPGRVRVTVATRETGPGPDGPDAGRPGLAFLRVSDTGVGIPRDKQDGIFEPFVQVRSGYAQATEGTGLGLAISRDLARGMGGDLRVRSREAEGSTFTVALRRVVDAAGQATDRRLGGERRDEEERRSGDDRRQSPDAEGGAGELPTG